MATNFLKSPIWKRYEKSGKALQQLQAESNKLYEGYVNFFDVFGEWTSKFQALNNTVLPTGSVAGINPVQNEMRNETIFAIADHAKESQSVLEAMARTDKALFDEIWDNTKLFTDIAKYLSQNISNTKECETKVQAAENALAKASQNYEVMKSHLKIATDTLEKQKALYFQVVN